MTAIQIDAYALARAFLKDSTHLTDEEKGVFLGYIRARRPLDVVDHCEFLTTYDCRERTRELFQLAAFFKKNADFCDSEAATLKAESNFRLSEHRCSMTNDMILAHDKGAFMLLPKFETAIFKMRSFIRHAMGCERVFLDSIPSRIRVTAGASATARKRRSLPHLKMRSTISCTSGAIPFVTSMLRLVGHDPRRTKVIAFNRIALVPKDCRTFRTIAAEPEGNLPFQLAVDEYMKERLRRYGVDLRSQRLNYEKAKEGSITDRLATIDLSMASDTLARELIPWLFPDGWSSILERLRSPYFIGPFGKGYYEKFSSMGNGYTFPLETLIFFSACKAVGCSFSTAYGDDIICDVEHYEEVVELLEFLGFTPNMKKSFRTGPFRESCGGNFFGGVDITPVKLWACSQQRAEFCDFANRLLAVTLPSGAVWRLIRGLVLSKRVLVGHYNSNITGYVHVDDQKKVRRHHGMWSVSAYVYVPRKRHAHALQLYLLWFVQKLRTRSSPSEVSNPSLLTHRVRRKRVWILNPHERVPVHVSLWTGFLSSSA